MLAQNVIKFLNLQLNVRLPTLKLLEFNYVLLTLEFFKLHSPFSLYQLFLVLYQLEFVILNAFLINYDILNELVQLILTFGIQSLY